MNSLAVHHPAGGAASLVSWSGMFSSRLPPRLAPNALSQAVARARSAGTPLFDLTESNPTAVGIPYPVEIAAALADPEALRYRPDPVGLERARRAVAQSMAPVRVDPDDIVLSASTSEAYSFLFRLLCDAGDEVLVPQPSYPLFELLSSLDGVRAIPYRLDPAGAWCLDRDAILQALSPRTRAILVVSPNNPTGSVIRADDKAWLVGIASEHRLPVVADEVFAQYRLSMPSDVSSFVGERGALTFTLGGLSKSAGLPQVKLAWTIVSGPRALVDDALARLSIIADTYLSVSTPVQIAAERLIAAGVSVRAAIQQRLTKNLKTLRTAAAAYPTVTLLEPSGGWSVVIRVPAVVPEDELVLRLLADAAVLVHPGYFFDFDTEAYLVLSLLPDEAVFREGCARLLQVVGGLC
jgi:hypothetical protein